MLPANNQQIELREGIEAVAIEDSNLYELSRKLNVWFSLI